MRTVCVFVVERERENIWMNLITFETLSLRTTDEPTSCVCETQLHMVSPSDDRAACKWMRWAHNSVRALNQSGKKVIWWQNLAFTLSNTPHTDRPNENEIRRRRRRKNKVETHSKWCQLPARCVQFSLLLLLLLFVSCAFHRINLDAVVIWARTRASICGYRVLLHKCTQQPNRRIHIP